MPNVVVIAYQDPDTGVITNVQPPIPITADALDNILVELQGLNPLSDDQWDEQIVTFADEDKDVITQIDWKLDGDIVRTIGISYGATTDTFTKS